MTIITKDFLGTDLTFAQIIAKHLGLNLSLIQVSIGSTKALHQVMMVSDQTDVYTQQLPFLSVSNDDVLDRYYQCAKLFNPKYIVRLTGDCPLTDWQEIDKMIQYCKIKIFWLINCPPQT